MATWGHVRPVEAIRVADGWLAGRRFIGRDLESRAVLRLKRGHGPLAEAALERAVQCARDDADWKLAVRALARLVAVAKGDERWERAAALTEELVAVGEESRSRMLLGIALRIRGELLFDPRYLADVGAERPSIDAWTAFEVAIATLEQEDDPIELLITLRAFACCLLSQGRTNDALLLMRRAKHLIAH